MVLALELAFIRQIPAEVRVISYFTNLLLMAAFLGFGVGCILEEKRPLGLLLPAGMALVWGFVALARGLVIFDAASPVHYWLLYAEVEGVARSLPVLPAALAAFVFAALPFVALGQALAREMSGHSRLVAYAWDIAGSLAGVLLFAVASRVGIPPWIWPPLLAAGWAAVFVTGWPARIAHVAAGLLFLGFSQTPHAGVWSPYYFIQHKSEPYGLRVWVNSSFHQLAIDFRSREPGSVAEFVNAKFSAPYGVYRHIHGRSPRSVLVLGAGTGNDVVVALRNGAERVDAVEIDPAILEIGRRLNVSRPYSDPRVKTHVDDARHFVRTTTGRYDMVVLGTLDSQTLLSGHANIRLENYVYTVESFRDFRRVLAPEGLLAAYYSVFKPWLLPRIAATVATGFGEPYRLIRAEDQFLFNTLVLAGAGVDQLEGGRLPEAEMRGAITARDDWPFLYVENRGVAPIYLKLGAAILALVVGAGLLVRGVNPGGGFQLPFFLLGLGFTLVESAAIVRMALLFGSTWIVTVVVFGTVLATVFLANLAVQRGRAPSLGAAWGGVALGLLANALFPVSSLVGLPDTLKVLSAAILVGVPVFSAAVCFSRLFARSRKVGSAFGMNLIGAMSGGMVEYLSMLVGMRAVWLIALAVYLGALVASRFDAGPSA